MHAHFLHASLQKWSLYPHNTLPSSHNRTCFCMLLPCVLLQIARVQKMLGDEYGTASNIKSRVNRLSVLGAITSAQQRLKLYNKVRAFVGKTQQPRLLVPKAVWRFHKELVSGGFWGRGSCARSVQKVNRQQFGSCAFVKLVSCC